MSHARGYEQVVRISRGVSAEIRSHVQGLRALGRVWPMENTGFLEPRTWDAEVVDNDDPRHWVFQISTAGTSIRMSLSRLANLDHCKVRKRVAARVGIEIDEPSQDTMHAIRNAQLRDVYWRVLAQHERVVVRVSCDDPMRRLTNLAWETRHRWRGLVHAWDDLAATIRAAAGDPLLEMPLAVNGDGMLYVRGLPNNNTTTVKAFAACRAHMRELLRHVSRTRADAVFRAVRPVVYRYCDPLHERAVHFVAAATCLPDEIKHMIIMEYCVPVHHATLCT